MQARLALFHLKQSWHKTGARVNASPRLFVIGRLEPFRTSLLLCACSAAMLSGCAVSSASPPPRWTPASPIAAEVAAKARASRVYPTFADIPPVPADVRPLPAFGRAATELEVAGAETDPRDRARDLDADRHRGLRRPCARYRRT